MNIAPQKLTLVAELRDLSVTYGTGAVSVNAVRGISLEVHRGEVLLMMGPSGSGKSTLLQVLGCIRPATSGSVLIDGKTVSGLTQNELSQLRSRRIGFVFQHYNLLPTLRAWENVALALELQGEYGSRLEQASRRILRALGLGDRVDAYPSELSGGEKQRVAIARAVIGSPDLILADEPTAALDAAQGNVVAKLLVRIAHEHGCAVVIVTHDPRIEGVADRIAFLEDGVIRSIHKKVHMQNPLLRENGAHEVENLSRGSPDSSVDRDAAVVD